MDFIRMALILLVPGIIGALAYSIVDRFQTQIQFGVSLVINLLTLLTMIFGLYLFRCVTTFCMLSECFGCVRFTIKYSLLSILVAIIIGAGLGFLRKLFFWIKR